MNNNGSKSKKVRKSNEELSEDVILSSITSDPIDVYHEVVSMGEGSVVYLWLDMGGSFLSSEDHPEAFEAVSEIAASYQKDIKVANIELELEDQDKQISDLQKEHDKMVKMMEKQKAEIEDCISLLKRNISDEKIQNYLVLISFRFKEVEEWSKRGLQIVKQ